ncbi:MAG: dipeptide/oligopeptide/nickel ABC transporter ATP-binding protein, partial [Actinomycetota bacterium]|nr:dipeptide/oligopeptide/nickel ABC transporter ATP-binding protein [Actinomycetota bacterium]
MSTPTQSQDAAAPAAELNPAADDSDALLRVNNVAKHFPIKQGILIQRQIGAVRAVDGVSFAVRAGETLGLVGESGCGKSTTGRVVAKLLDPTSGQIFFDGRDIAELSRRQMRALRTDIQMIFQDPYSSLNPRHTIGTIVGAPFRIQNSKTENGIKAEVQSLMQRVGLNPEHYNRYPHEFSGGQRQRIGIARAIALRPKLIVCDEPVSALDVSIQAQVVNLLEDLQNEFGLTYIFIAHDLSVVRHIADRVA